MIDAVCYFNVDDTQLHLALVCILDLYDDVRRQVPLHSRKSLKTGRNCRRLVDGSAENDFKTFTFVSKSQKK